ncbi:hypothetical protein BN381_130220 [Candidatus Microthrix parvicella RN1]|uniref:Uncharacterized protein n=1 Tax=Candidatus Neomicrothrix parvicella RN1 TaxID=1229780 RepID=R4Z222_9ACTN|nr:hypothetical protein BN381_130220 [Candidatus Microthrix parvicella RN1]
MERVWEGAAAGQPIGFRAEEVVGDASENVFYLEMPGAGLIRRRHAVVAAQLHGRLAP